MFARLLFALGVVVGCSSSPPTPEDGGADALAYYDAAVEADVAPPPPLPHCGATDCVAPCYECRTVDCECLGWSGCAAPTGCTRTYCCYADGPACACDVWSSSPSPSCYAGTCEL